MIHKCAKCGKAIEYIPQSQESGVRGLRIPADKKTGKNHLETCKMRNKKKKAGSEIR